MKILKFFLPKTDPNASHLFNECVEDAISYPKYCDIQYTDGPMKKRSYVNFLPDICKAAGCKRYTEYYLKTTAIQAMNDAGFKARHVIHFSGHRNDASISTFSYNRLLSSTPPKSANATLSTTAASVNKMIYLKIHFRPTFKESSNCSLYFCPKKISCSTMSDLSIKSEVLNSSRFENCSITIKYMSSAEI